MRIAFAIFVVLFVIVALLIAAADAAEPPVETVMFNGSPMTLQARGYDIEIRYVDPPPGIEPSALLLAGRWTGRVLLATAYVFTAQCGAFPFEVHGGVDAYGNLVVRGRAPLVDMFRCQQYGTEWNHSSLLVFTHPTELPVK